MAAASRREVILNIYDLTDEQGTGTFARKIGLGAYHTGVEVGGVEYTFAQNGIFFHTPKTPMVAPGQVVKLRESTSMGTHVGSANDVHGVINKLREEFATNAYHPVQRNCNHFSDRLCQELVGAKIPAWINRPANIGRFFSFGGGGKGGKGGGTDGKQGQQEKAGGKGNKAAWQKKELTEEQRKRLEAIRRAGEK